MKYLLAGGDERAMFAAEALTKEGNGVAVCAMDKAELPSGIRKAAEIESADCVILPLPVESGRSGMLNAPFAEYPVRAAELLNKLSPKTLVCGGKISPALKNIARENDLRIADIMQRAEFVTGNAAITAEAAVALLMQRTDYALFGRSAMVIGYGRIGRILSHKLRALGVKTYIMSRNAESRALATALGCFALAPDDELPKLDIVVNTSPAPVMTELTRICSPCLMLELASAPGGIDGAEAQRLGHRYFAAPGLPGKYAPRTAGRLIAETVKSLVKEYLNE